MKLFNDMKTRLVARLFCKVMKSRGLSMDDAQELVEAEWDQA